MQILRCRPVWKIHLASRWRSAAEKDIFHYRSVGFDKEWDDVFADCCTYTARRARRRSNHLLFECVDAGWNECFHSGRHGIDAFSFQFRKSVYFTLLGLPCLSTGTRLIFVQFLQKDTHKNKSLRTRVRKAVEGSIVPRNARTHRRAHYAPTRARAYPPPLYRPPDLSYI